MEVAVIGMEQTSPPRYQVLGDVVKCSERHCCGRNSSAESHWPSSEEMLNALLRDDLSRNPKDVARGSSPCL